MPRRGRWGRRKWEPEDESEIISERQSESSSTSETTQKSEIIIDNQMKKGKPSPPIDNLGSRHRALNTKVNDAFANQVNFDSAKTTIEGTEVDKLFKIDLASKYKNVNYIVDILKSGDSLYTARALKKCQWLFSDDYAYIINPEYLHENIFPVISMRMKRKILKAAAKNITNPDRAVKFYHFCMKEKMINSAFTCLVYTSEAFKIDILQNKNEPVRALENKDILYIRFLVGKSFAVLQAFLEFLTLNWKISLTARQFKHLYYLVSNEQYLDIVEKYVFIWYGFQTDKFDAKLSENIMKNHKDRVLAKPKFYINTVNTDVLVKYSTIDDLKIYASVILPDTGYAFWSRNYYSIFEPVFKIIPEEETYIFFKNFVAEHYSGTEFEMHRGFYDHKFYEFMTAEQQQEWALCHLKSQKQILGVGNDYLWYRFIKFELAFPEIKELINITKKAETRNDMAKILIESANNNRELESLFIYYHKRHLKELRSYKDTFLNKVISHHNVFEFDKKCWAAFYDVLLSMDLFNKADTTDKKNYEKANNTYKIITVLFQILHDEPFSEELMKFFLEDFDVNSIDYYLEDIDQEKYQKLHDFFFDIYMKNLVGFQHQPCSKALSESAQRYFCNMKISMAKFHKEVLQNETKQRSNHKKRRYISDRLSDQKLLRDLKKDKGLVVIQVPDVKTEYENCPFRLNNFLKKVKIYFPEDIAKVYLSMFEKLIDENKDFQPVKAGIHGIFNLGDERTKLDLMNKYVPTTAKIDRKSIDIIQLRAQKAICRYACISRPPVPLSSMVMYMKGNYAKYCVHVFNTYLATLPLPMCLEFVYLVIDAPISIQKHAIRLAFQCFSTESLIKVISDIWGKTKNVSMRSVIYKALFNKVVETKEQLFVDVLLKFTISLHQNDENELFDLVVSNRVSEDFLGDYIEAVWGAIDSFEYKQPNLKRKENVIRCIQDNIHLLRKTFVLAIIQPHLEKMIEDNKLKITYANEDLSQLYKENWKLTARYIMHYTRFGSQAEEYVNMSQYVVKHSINNWNEIICKFMYQRLLWDFFTDLNENSFKFNTENFEDGLPIFEDILSLVKLSLPFQDTYKIIWELELAIMTRKIVKKNRNSFKNDDLYDVIIETMKEISNELGRIVSRYADANMYFMSYSSNIKEIVINHAKTVLHIIYYYDKKSDEVEYLDDVLITLASGLVEIELCETYMLAVQLLPTDSEEEEEENFKFVFNKLLKYSNPEVQFSLHQKFHKLCINNKT